MPYDIAVFKAWNMLGLIAKDEKYRLFFLSDEYDIDIENKTILSLSCNVSPKDYLTILLLHYLARKLNGLPELKGEWISFQQLAGGPGYFPAFKKRVVDRISGKYKNKPEALLELIPRFKARKEILADYSVVLDVFECVPVLITAWGGDDEFPMKANIHFDKSISDILCTEDIVVMSEFIAAKI